MNETTTVETQAEATGNLVFSVNKPTPMWATWVFRIQFIINKALLFWLAGTKLLTPDQIQEALLILGAVDLITWGFGRVIGIEKPHDK